MSDAIIGSVGVAVVPDARDFWRRFKEQTEGGREGAAPKVKVEPDTSDVERRLALLRAQIDATSGTVNVRADTSRATFQMHLLADSIIALGPAAVPLAGVLGGALVGLGPALGAAVAGVVGINSELKSGALAGTQFGSILTGLQSQLKGLSHTAADGLLAGLSSSMGTLTPLIGLLNSQIGLAARQLGTAFAGALPGILTILKQLNPLFVTFGNLLVTGAQHFTHWAQSSTAVTSFVNYVKAELPAVGHFIAELAQLVSHLVQGFAPLGGAVLSGLTVMISAINAIPINVLQALVPLLTAGYIAFRAYAGLSVITATITGAAAAIKALGTVSTASAIEAKIASITETEAARASSLAITAAARASIAASRSVVAQKDAEAAAFVAANEVEMASARAAALFFTATNEEYAVASAALIRAKETEAAAVAQAASAEAAAVVAAAAVVTATAEAEAAAITGAGEKASIGWAGFVPVLGAVAIGVALFSGALGGNAKAAQEAAAAENSYASSLAQTTNALAGVNIQQTNKNLADAGAFSNLDILKSKNSSLALTYRDLTLAVNGTGPQFSKVADDVVKMIDPFSKSGRAADALFKTLLQYRSGLEGQTRTQTELNTANAASLSITDQQAATGARLFGLVGDKGVAAYLAAKQAAQQLTDQTQAQTLAFQLENDAGGLLQLTLDKLSGKQLGAAQAQNAFEQQLVNLAKHTTAADAAITGLSSSAVKNRGDLLNLVTSAEAAAEAYGKQTGKTEDARQKLIALRKQIIDNAVAHGEDRKAVTRFIDSILKIPAKLPPTKLDVDSAAAAAKLAVIVAALKAAGITVSAKILADTSIADAAIARTLQQLRNLNGATATTYLNTVTSTNKQNSGSSGHVSPYTGGYITGPGSGTSDSIPAMLSNGEFVVNAAQTSKHRELLHAINNGVKGYAAGGDVVTLTPSKASLAHAAKVKITVDSISITAGDGAAYGIANIVRGNIPQTKAAMADLSAAVNDAFTLKGITAKLASVKTALAALVQQSNQLRSSVQGKLSGSVDASKYADIGGLLGAYSNQTGVNTKFDSELTKLAGEGLNKGLLQQLAEAGPSAGLDTLAAASKAQIKQVNAAFGSFSTSAAVGGASAAKDVFGSQIAADQRLVATLTASQRREAAMVDKLVASIAKLTGRPVQVTLDGKVIAKAVFSSKEFQGVLDSLSHHLVYG